MTKRAGGTPPWTIHEIEDDAYPPREYATVGAIRYDGDPDVFTALAWVFLMDHGGRFDQVQPPVYTRFRCQPDPSGEYPWRLTEVRPDSGRSLRGTWAGAEVRIAA